METKDKKRPVRNLKVFWGAIALATTIVFTPLTGCKKETSLDIAKKFANQVYSNPTMDQIKEIQNMILFINHSDMPEGFDVYENFFKPLAYFINIDNVAANRNFFNNEKIIGKRTPIAIEDLFTTKEDIAIVKHGSDRQHTLLDAIYDGKSNEIVNKLINESMATMKELLIDYKAAHGIDPNKISDEAALTARLIYSTIISKAQYYPNIRNISTQVKKDQATLMENIEYGYNQRRTKSITSNVIKKETQKINTR